MIGYIRGKVTALFKDSCFLEAGGIGYRIFISDKTRQQLAKGEEAKLLTYMSVREDAILLYGFLGKEEYDLFLLLISISKVGPKVAMGILSAMTPSAFVGAITTGSVTRLTKLPGIGKKSAQRHRPLCGRCLRVVLRFQRSLVNLTFSSFILFSPLAWCLA